MYSILHYQYTLHRVRHAITYPCWDVLSHVRKHLESCKMFSQYRDCSYHGPLARKVKWRVAQPPGKPGTFPLTVG